MELKTADKATDLVEQTVGIEKTQVVYGEKNALDAYLNFLLKSKLFLDICGDANAPSVDIGVQEYNDALLQAKKRGFRIRYVTEITKGNVRYCKQLAETVQLRHLDNVKGNFAVTDNQYLGAGTLPEAKPVPMSIFSDIKEIVEQHQFLFETLWSKAVPAEQKIREIEEGTETEFLELITDGEKAADIMIEFAKSVRKNARIILPRAIAMERGENLRIWDLLAEAANIHGAEVKIITPLTEQNAHLARQIAAKAPGIKILAGPVSSVGLFIQDDKRYFRAEYKDIDVYDFAKSIRNVIYSNSKNGATWFSTFFEALWKQSELYEQLTTANEKLLLHDKMQEEFINIAAHELRTPVQPLLGIANILEAELGGKDRIEVTKDVISMIIRNAVRLERLSSEILTASRVESQSLKLNKERIDLNENIRNVTADVGSSIENSQDLKLVLEPCIEPVTVEADKSKLFEVVSNLLRNAVKFTEKGTITVSLKKQDDGYVSISIKDSGKGIDPEIMPRLFEKFATKGEMEGGTGLGLFISKSIIEAHGGGIWARNNENGIGAVFTFTLPLAN